MSEALRALELRVSANFAEVKSAFQNLGNTVQQEAAKLKSSVNNALAPFKALGDTMERVGAIAAKAFAFTAVISGLGLLTSSIGDVIDEITKLEAGLGDMSEEMGTTVEEMSRISQVAKVAGVDIDTVNKAFSKLNQRSDSANNALRYLTQTTGITFETTLSYAETVDRVAAAFNTLENNTNKNKLATDAFGKEGRKIISFLNDYIALADITGTTTKEQADAAEQYQFQVKRLELVFDGVKKTIVDAAVPALTAFLQVLTDTKTGTGSLSEKVTELARDGTLIDWAENVVLTFGYVKDAVSITIGVIKAIGTTIQSVATLALAGFDLITSSVLLFLKGLVKVGSQIPIAGQLFDGLNATLEATTPSFEALAAKMSLAGDASKDAFDEMANSVTQAGRSFTDAGNSSFTPFFNSLRQKLAQNKESTKSLEDIKNNANDYRQFAEGAKKSIEIVIKATGDLQSKTNQLMEELARGSTSLNEYEKDYLDLSTGVGALSREFDAAIKKSKDLIRVGQTPPISPEVIEGLRQEAIELAKVNVLLSEQIAFEKKLRDAVSEKQKLAEKDKEIINKYDQDLSEHIEKLKFQNSLIGKTAEQQRELTLAYELEAKTKLVLRSLSNEIGDEERKRIEAALTAQTDRIKQLSKEGVALQELNQKWKELWTEVDDIGRSAFASLFESGDNTFKKLGESLKKWLINELYNLTVRKFLVNVVADVSGQSANSLTGGSSGSGGGIGGAISSLFGGGGSNGLSTAANIVSNLSSGVASLGSLFGSTALTAFGEGLSGTVGISSYFAAPAAANAGLAASGVVSGIATVAPWIAAAIIAIQLLTTALNDSENPELTLGFGRGVQAYASQGVFGAEGFQNTALSDAANRQFSAFFDGLRAFDETLSEQLNVFQRVNITNALESQQQRQFAFPPGDATAAEQVTLEYLRQKYSIVFGELNKNLGNLIGGFEGSSKDLLALLGTFSAVDFSELTPQITYLLDNLKGLDSDSLNQFIQMSQAMTSLIDSADQVGIAFNQLSGKELSDFIARLGGAQASVQTLSGFYSTFYTQQEQVANAQEALNEQLAGLGVNLQVTVGNADQANIMFRDLIATLGQQPAENERVIASLLRLSPAFAQVTAAMTETALAVSAVRNNVDPALAGFRALSDEGLALFITNLGGAAEAQNRLNQFYTSFTPAAEQAANAQEYINTSMRELGVNFELTAGNADTAVHDFRALIQELSTAPEANQQLIASLIQLSPQLLSATRGVQDMASASAAAAARIQSTLTSLSSSISNYAPQAALRATEGQLRGALQRYSDIYLGGQNIGISRIEELFDSLDSNLGSLEYISTSENGSQALNDLIDLYSQYQGILNNHKEQTQQQVDQTDYAAEAAKAVAEALAKMNQALSTQSSLWNKYALDVDKYVKAQANLAIGFASIGASVPKTADEFARLISSVDVTTTSGQELIAKLSELSTSFDVVQGFTENLRKEHEALAKSYVDSITKIADQIPKVQNFGKSIEDAIQSVNFDRVDFDKAGFYDNLVSSLQGQLAKATDTDTRIAVGGQLKDAILARYKNEVEKINESRKAITDSTTKQIESIQKVKNVQERANDEAIRAQERLFDIAKSIGDYSKSLLLSDLSPLTNAQKFAESQQQFRDIAASAGSDPEAAAKLQKAAESYLTAAREQFRSSTAYTDIFAEVQGRLGGFTAGVSAPVYSAFEEASLQYDEQIAELNRQQEERQAAADEELRKLQDATVLQLQDLAVNPRAWETELNQLVSTQISVAMQNGVTLVEIREAVRSMGPEIGNIISAAVQRIADQQGRQMVQSVETNGFAIQEVVTQITNVINRNTNRVGDVVIATAGGRLP